MTTAILITDASLDHTEADVAEINNFFWSYQPWAENLRFIVSFITQFTFVYQYISYINIVSYICVITREILFWWIHCSIFDPRTYAAKAKCVEIVIFFYHNSGIHENAVVFHEHSIRINLSLLWLSYIAFVCYGKQLASSFLNINFLKLSEML